MSMRYVTTNVRFDPRDYEDLQRLAAASGNSLAAHVRLAVSAYLGHVERPGEPEAGTSGSGGAPEVPAVVHGNTLVLEEPLQEFREGTRVWVHCLAEAEVRLRHERRQLLARLLDEFEAMPPGKPAAVGDDDRELYRS